MPIQCTHRLTHNTTQRNNQDTNNKTTTKTTTNTMPIQCICRLKTQQKNNQITNAYKIRKALHHASAAHSDHRNNPSLRSNSFSPTWFNAISANKQLATHNQDKAQNRLTTTTTTQQTGRTDRPALIPLVTPSFNPVKINA